MKLLRALLIPVSQTVFPIIHLWPLFGGRNWFDTVVSMFFSILILKKYFPRYRRRNTRYTDVHSEQLIIWTFELCTVLPQMIENSKLWEGFRNSSITAQYLCKHCPFTLACTASVLPNPVPSAENLWLFIDKFSILMHQESWQQGSHILNRCKLVVIFNNFSHVSAQELGNRSTKY